MCQTCDRTTNLSLFYEEGTNPKDYRLSLEIGSSSDPIYEVDEQNYAHQMGATLTNFSEYNVDVQLDQIPSGYSELSIMLGPISVASSDVCFVLTIADSNGNNIGGGRIRVEEGEQETRPIEAFEAK